MENHINAAGEASPWPSTQDGISGISSLVHNSDDAEARRGKDKYGGEDAVHGEIITQAHKKVSWFQATLSMSLLYASHDFPPD
jgi:hypothetical protein